MDAIAEGATSFLITEYKYMGVFMVREKGREGERERGREGERKRGREGEMERGGDRWRGRVV